LLCDANKRLLHAISASGMNWRIHEGGEVLSLIRRRLDALVTLQALVEIVAGFGTSAEQSSGHQRAEHARGTQPAFHAQPEQIELGIVGNDLDGFESCLQFTEIVADGAEVDDPRLLVLYSQREQPDVTGQWIETIAFARTVGFQIERDRLCLHDPNGDLREHVARNNRNRSLAHVAHALLSTCTTIYIYFFIFNIIMNYFPSV
jgi:hypothetical protein